MKLKYGSKKANEFVGAVMRIMLIEAVRTSSETAALKGTFGRYDWKKTARSPIVQLLKTEAPDVYESVKEHGLRNGTLLSIAPTGTISLLMGTFSGGCEPLYKISYERTTHKMETEHKTFKVYAHSVKDLLDYHHLSYATSDEEIKKRFPWIIESHDVPFLNRVKLQSVMQKYVDNSISSTVNLKHEATPEDIKAIYLAAWKANCKGITVFRDGCKRGNILGVNDQKPDIQYDSIQPIRRNDIARLVGARFVTAVESEYGQPLAEAVIKQVTGGEPIVARFLFKEFFQFYPQFTLWLASNHKPIIKGGDHGIWRRIKLVPFAVTIPPEKQDQDLPSKLKAEGPGILNWMIQGCREWQRQGLNPPLEVMTAVSEYRSEMDLLAEFLDEKCILGPGEKVKAKDLYKAYREFCEAEGEFVLGKKRFADLLLQRGFRKAKIGDMIWSGLGLKQSTAQAAPQFSSFGGGGSPFK